MGSTSSGGLPISDLGFHLQARAPGFASTRYGPRARANYRFRKWTLVYRPKQGLLASGPRARVHEVGSTSSGQQPISELSFNTPIETLYGTLTAKLFREYRYTYTHQYMQLYLHTYIYKYIRNLRVDPGLDSKNNYKATLPLLPPTSDVFQGFCWSAKIFLHRTS